MDTKDFKDLCDRLLKKYGFKKKKTMYYKDSNDGIRCGVYPVSYTHLTLPTT